MNNRSMINNIGGRVNTMVTPKQIAEKTMTIEKRKSAKNDIFAFYIGRPISYVLTVPFIELGIKPNTISFFSFFPSIIGFWLLGFSSSRTFQVIGAFMFMLWNFMDGIDGNTARYTNQTSDLGTLWDAASGYLAGSLLYFSVGISVMNIPRNAWDILNIPDYYYLVLSGLTSILLLFSRLVMHKKMVLFSASAGDSLRDKSTYSWFKLIYLNITSPSGFIDVFLIIAIIFNFVRLFVLLYFLIHFLATVYSLKELLKA